MALIKFIIMVLAFFVTLLWVTKLITDCVSTMYGSSYSPETAEKDAYARIYMILAMSILWPLTIML